MQSEGTVTIHQHLRHLLQGRRSGQRNKAVERQEAGIAERSRLAGFGTVQKGDAMAGALQGAGGGGADDAGANDDDGVAHGLTLARPLRAEMRD